MPIKKNKLNVIDNDGTIHLDWEVNQRSNTQDEWLDSLDDTQELWFSNDGAIFDIFDLGLVIQTLVRNIEDKTPSEYKKYFYSREITELPYNNYANYSGRLKIFGHNGWDEMEELHRRAQHMVDFYALWKDFKFGQWKLKIVNKQKNINDMFPFRVFFEWKYPNFFVFDQFIPRSHHDDMYYLCTAAWERTEAPEDKFCYMIESDVKHYEREKKNHE